MRIARVAIDGREAWVADSGAGWRRVPSLFDRLPAGEEHVEPDEFLAPMVPGAALIGLNHNTPGANPLPIQGWLKSSRTIIGDGGAIVARTQNGTVTAEGELAAVIGAPTRGVSAESILDCVVGYTVANDVTDADQAAVDSRAFQAKQGAGYSPIGPWIETAPVGDLDDLAIEVAVNGAVRRATSTAGLGADIAACVAYAARWMDLQPGDIVMTGTPMSMTPIVPGDEIVITIAGIGTLRNSVR